MRKISLNLVDKVTLTQFFLVFLLMLITWGVLALILPNAMQSLILNERETTAQRIAQPVEISLTDLKEELGLINQLGTTTPNYPLQTGLQAILVHSDEVREIVVVTPKGDILYSAVSDNTVLLSDPATTQNAAWFLTAQTGKDYISSLYFSTLNEPYITFSYKETKGTLAGDVIAARMDAHFLQQLLDAYQADPNEQFYIFQNDGTLVAHSDPSLVPKLPQQTAFLEQFNYDEYKSSWSGTYTSLDGATVLGAIEPIQNAPWVVVAEIHRGVALHKTFVLLANLGIVTFLFAIVLTLIGRWLTFSLIRPLKVLEKATLEISDGDFSRRIPIESKDEIGRVALAFNKMVSGIEYREQRLRVLSQRVIEAQEDERRRISREIHDGVGQILASARISVDLGLRVNEERRVKFLNEASTQLELAMDELHSLAENLRPIVLDDLGLVRAVEWFTSRLSQRTGLTIECNFQNIQGRLDEMAEVAVYRFIQECLNNVIKHAKATKVTINLYSMNDRIILSVKDNGVGFSVEDTVDRLTPSLGLSGLKERLALINGDLVVISFLGSGSILLAELPAPLQADTAKEASQTLLNVEGEK